MVCVVAMGLRLSGVRITLGQGAVAGGWHGALCSMAVQLPSDGIKGESGGLRQDRQEGIGDLKIKFNAG